MIISANLDICENNSGTGKSGIICVFCRTLKTICAKREEIRINAQIRRLT